MTLACIAGLATAASSRRGRTFTLLMAGLPALLLTAQLYRLGARIRIRFETGDDFLRYFALDETFDIAQETALIHTDQ